MLEFSVELSFAVIFAYLCGSISAAILVCRLLGYPDPRSEGSRNPGTTNVLRIAGKKAAILTLLGDTLKGFLPVLAAKLCGFTNLGLTSIACAAFLGHLYPVFFGFKGGKGVATAFGACSALTAPAGLILSVSWITVAFITRYSSLAAILTSLIAPLIIGYYLTPAAGALISAMSILLIYRHKINIKKLLTGTENKIGKK